MPEPLLHRQVGKTFAHRTHSGTQILTITSGRTNPDLPPVIVNHGWAQSNTAEKMFQLAKGQFEAFFGKYVGTSLDALAASGYAMYLPYTGSNWCSNTVSPSLGGTGQDAFEDAISLAASDGFDASKVHFFSTSMGAGNALNWAWRNPTAVASMYLLAPFVDFASTYDTAKASEMGVRTSMHTVYGVGNRTNLLVACEPNDPVRNTASLMGIGPLIKASALTEDEVVPYASLSAFLDAIGATEATTPGSHFLPWTMTAFNEYAIPAWFAEHQP